MTRSARRTPTQWTPDQCTPSKCLLLCLLATAGLLGQGCAGGMNRPPQLITQVGPEYPATARTRGQEGEVTVSYSIGLDGKVSNLKVVASSPTGLFDESALKAVAQWQYKPPVVEGEPRAADNVTSTLTFRLDNDTYVGYE